MAQSFSELDNWYGSFPGEHEFSELGGLQQYEDGPDMAVFKYAADKLITEWQGNKFTGLFLYGTPGTGKTHAALGLGRELAVNGVDVHYRYVPTLLEGYKDVNNWTGKLDSTSNEHRTYHVFPAQVGKDVTRNPRTALILDDYKPEKQRSVAAAIEAGAQYGGLVIITSNHADPFRLTEVYRKPEELLRDGQLSDMKEQAAASGNQNTHDAIGKYEAERERRLAEFSGSLRSRIAAGFKFIEFSGPDRRIENSFW